MEINDRIYGCFEIEEPILKDLINSNEVQRLKGISMMGMPGEYWHTKVYSRFEHSLGVMLLLRKLGADLKEQIAGLVHDVSHTAFSHVIDWVAGDPNKEDFQDKIHLEVIAKSNIPHILEKYGFRYEEIAELELFGLLDRAMPDLCADRFDYAIREIKDFEKSENVKSILENLLNNEGILAFKSREAAEIFSEGYLKRQREHWAADESRARYYLMSDALKTALKEKIIVFEDFRKTDDELIKLLQDSRNQKITHIMTALKNGFSMVESEIGFPLLKKIRFVDPLVVEYNSSRLSDISPKYRELLKTYMEASRLIKHMEIIY